MAPARLLVVAPDVDLRSSLAFALEAEGFVVVARDLLPDPGVALRFDCCIIEQKALAPGLQPAIEFCDAVQPIVLLAARPLPWLAHRVAHVVETPDTAGAMLRAVRMSVGTAD